MTYPVLIECLYCFCCRLLEEPEGGQSAFVSMGLRAWWKLKSKVSKHENCPDHGAAFKKWEELRI